MGRTKKTTAPPVPTPAPASAPAELSQASKHYIESFAANLSPFELAQNTKEPQELVDDYLGQMAVRKKKKAKFARHSESGAVMMTEGQSRDDDEHREQTLGRKRNLSSKINDCIHIIRPGEPTF